MTNISDEDIIRCWTLEYDVLGYCPIADMLPDRGNLCSRGKDCSIRSLLDRGGKLLESGTVCSALARERYTKEKGD